MIKEGKKINIFKPNYLPGKSTYSGGKSKRDVVANGQTIYKLSSNENMLGSSPKAMAAIQRHVNSLNEYPDRKDTRFRQALSEFYDKQLTANQFITTNSGVANLELIIRAFIGENMETIISNPAFGPYAMFTKKEGGKVVDIPLSASDFSIDVDGILNAITDNTRLICLTSPNNPTGSYLSKNEVDRLIYNVPEHVVIVFDEVYFQYAHAEDYTRALPYVLEGKNVIAVNSFSKAYGLAGLRIGYAYSTPEIATYLQQIRRPFMLNTLSMEAAMAALNDDEFIRATTTLIHREKPRLYAALNRVGMKYWATQANFILIKPDISSAEFEERMLQEGIMVRPVDNFGAPGCIRVTIGTEEANNAFIKALEKVSKESKA